MLLSDTTATATGARGGGEAESRGRPGDNKEGIAASGVDFSSSDVPRAGAPVQDSEPAPHASSADPAWTPLDELDSESECSLTEEDTSRPPAGPAKPVPLPPRTNLTQTSSHRMPPSAISRLPQWAFLYAAGSTRGTWKLPVRDLQGRINLHLLRTVRGKLQSGKVRAQG